MTQDGTWIANYEEVTNFLKTSHRILSKYNLEERRLYTWCKHCRKQMNAGEFIEPRLGMFKELLELSEEYKRVNQWK